MSAYLVINNNFFNLFDNKRHKLFSANFFKMKSAYFFLSSYVKPEKANYQHLSVVLGEGLEELGWKIDSNIDYWWIVEEKRWLFEKREPGKQSDVPDIVFVDSIYLNNQVDLRNCL